MTLAETVSRDSRWVHRRSRSQIPTNHVAAICYRVRDGQIEFLLVKTRAGRWTFPKGKVDDDATRAAAAAREAHEEAGVFGRVDSFPFTTYLHSKAPHLRLAHSEFYIDAHLFEVRELVPPEETHRDPTWFSAKKSKHRLHQGRRLPYGAELARVVDHAVEKISRRHRRIMQ